MSTLGREHRGNISDQWLSSELHEVKVKIMFSVAEMGGSRDNKKGKICGRAEGRRC